MTNAQNVLVIGTGLAGLTQALALAERGIAVTLVGPVPAEIQDDRTTAILNPGIDFLRGLGVYDSVNGNATPLVTMELVDGKTHHVYDAAEIDAGQFGFNISNKALTDTLSARLDTQPLVKWHKTLATEIHNTTPWRVKLKDGQEVTGHLLVGADGRNSPVRAAADIGLRSQDIDQHAMVGVLQAEKPHYNITLELFRRGGPLTLVPVGKNKFALVWCDDSAILQATIAYDRTRIGAELTTLTEGRFGNITVADDLQLWPVRPMHAVNLIGKNCVLIGDAAHTLPPIGAQGFNTTLQDVMALTDILVRNRTLGLTLNDAAQLRAYEAKRLPDILMRYRTVNLLNRLLRSANPLAHSLRRVSLGGLDRIGFLKKQIMHLGLRPRA